MTIEKMALEFGTSKRFMQLHFPNPAHGKPTATPVPLGAFLQIRKTARRLARENELLRAENQAHNAFRTKILEIVRTPAATTTKSDWLSGLAWALRKGMWLPVVILAGVTLGELLGYVLKLIK